MAEIERRAEGLFMDRLTDLQNQLDRRIETQLRELTDARNHLEALIHGNDSTLREKITAIEMVMTEQARAIDKAERERDKAATAINDAMHDRVQLSNNALERHVDQQIMQVREALEAARREQDIRFSASQQAIAKAEQANEKRFESVNEFRAQLNDQATLFLPRESFEAVNAGWQQWREGIDKRLNVSSATGLERDKAKENITRMLIAGMGFVITFVVVAINLLLSN